MRLQTPRLILAAFTEDEAAAIASGDRSARAWVDDYPTEGDALLASLGLLGRTTTPSSDRPWGPFQVRDRATGLAIGGAGFKGPPDDEGCVEVGYGFAPSARGRGFATEAVRALCDLALVNGAVAVVAETHPGNTASEGVLERCGFAVASRTHEMTVWRRELSPPSTPG